jgi:hypothetical protein
MTIWNKSRNVNPVFPQIRVWASIVLFYDQNDFWPIRQWTGRLQTGDDILPMTCPVERV